tara:strand:- start:284 stop:538 length:255 start_codon:yes stop_codon:yes gene_type:complete
MKLLAFLTILSFSGLTWGWSGFDYKTGSYVEIETYNHGGVGEGEVEYFDYQDGQYKNGYLDMEPGGSGTLYDYGTGDYRYLDMD